MYDVAVMLPNYVDCIYYVRGEGIYQCRSDIVALRHITTFLGGFHYNATGG